MIRRSPYTLCSNKTHGAAAGCYAAITIMYQLGTVHNGLRSIMKDNSALPKVQHILGLSKKISGWTNTYKARFSFGSNQIILEPFDIHTKVCLTFSRLAEVFHTYRKLASITRS